MVNYGYSASRPLGLASGGTGLSEPDVSSLLIALGGLAVKTSTPVAGYTLVNATGVILSWTAPNDGNIHLVQLATALRVTSPETGGQIQFKFSSPDGTAGGVSQVSGGGLAAGVYNGSAIPVTMVGPNTTVTVEQTSALSIGAAQFWARILAN